MEVELEQGGVHHIAERGQEGGGGQGDEGVGPQEGEGADPVDDGGGQHPDEHRALDGHFGQQHDDKQPHEHGDHLEHHLAVAGAHGVAGGGGGERAEEVPHDEEGAAVLGVHARVGAQADVHQHQADGGGDAQAHPQGNGLHDFLADVEHGQHDEYKAFNEDDDQGGLEALHIAHAGDARDVGHHDGEEAVQAHAGGQAEGLVGQEGHGEHGDGGGDAGGQEHAVPQVLPLRAEAGEQVGVQGDDVGHRHERGQAGHDLGAHGGAVLLELENFLHKKLPLQNFLRDHRSGKNKISPESKLNFRTCSVDR